MTDQPMIEMQLGRIVMHDHNDRQYIDLIEKQGHRRFTIVIGRTEAQEIHRVIAQEKLERPMTHQLAASIIQALDAHVERCNIVDLRSNTFYAELVLVRRVDAARVVIDARPSDAVALALRAAAPIFVAESVLEEVRSDESGPDPLPPSAP